MSIDITTIGIGFDTSGLNKGTAALKENERQAVRTADAADGVSSSATKVSNAFSGLKGILATLGLGVVAKQFIDAADAMTLIDARLKLATGSLQEFASAQSEVYKIAQANNVGLKETAQLYTKLSDPIKQLGGTAREVGAIVDSFATSLRVGGASTQEAASATLQFAQAMASGKLSGDEFRSISEASPRFMKALAEGIGVPTGALKEMSSEGKLTADVVGNALIKSMAQLKSEAQSIPDTVGGAFTRMKNDTLVAVNELNKSSGLTLGIAELIESVRTAVPFVKNELSGAFETVGSFIKQNKDEISATFDSVMGLTREVYEVAKAFGAVVFGVTALAVETGAVRTAFEGVRLVVAGVGDGVTFIGGAFATVGSIILQVVLKPLAKVMEGIATFQQVIGNADMAASLNKSAEGIKNFAQAGAKYGDQIVSDFQRGNSAVGNLNAELAKSKQATDALRGSAGTNEMSNEMRRLGVRTGEVSAGFTLLRNPLKGLGADAKKTADEFSKLRDKINGKESGIDADFYKSVQLIKEEFQAGGIKIAEYTELLQKYIAQQKFSVDAAKETDEAQKALNKTLEEFVEANKKGVAESIAAAVEAEKKLATYGMLESQVQALTLAHLTESRELATLAGEDVANIEKRIDAQKRLIAATAGFESREVAEKQFKELANEGKQFADDLNRGLTDSLYRAFESGKGFFSTLWNGIKNLFKTTSLKLIVNAVVGGVTGGAGGLASAATDALGGGGGGGISGIGNIAGSLGSVGTVAGQVIAGGMSIANAFGTVAANITGTGLSGLLATNGAFGTAAAAGGAGIGSSITAGLAAIGPVGWAAIAAGSLLALTSGRGETRNGGQYDYRPELGTRLIAAPSGGDGGGVANRSAIEASAGLINSTLKALGSASTVSYLNSGLESSKNGKGFSYAGGELSTGERFGQGFGTGYMTNRGSKSAEQASTEYETEIFQATIAGIKAATDIPKSIAAKLALIDVESLTTETAKTTIAQITKEIAEIDGLRTALAALPFANLKALSFDAAAGLAAAAGGMDKLQSNLATYYQNFTSEEEQRLAVIKQINEATAGSGLDAAKATHKSFRALVDGQDLNTESGQKTYAALLSVSGAMAGILTPLAAIEPVATTVSEALRGLLETRASLEADLLQAQGNTGGADAEQRAIAIAGYGEAEIAAYDYNISLRNQITALGDAAQAAKDEAQAAKDAAQVTKDTQAAIASQRAGLQDQLNTLTDTAAQVLTRQRDALDESNRALFDRIQAIKAERLAIEQATAAARLTNVTGSANDAFTGLTRAVDAQKATELASYNAAKLAAETIYKAQVSSAQAAADAVKKSLSTIGEGLGKLRTLASSLKSTLDGMRILGSEGSYRTDAQAQISAALATARAGGGLPLDGQLQSALATVSKPSEQLFSNFTDYARDFYKTANDIAALSDLTDAQITADEITQGILQAQSDNQQTQIGLLKDGFADQVSTLDAILGNAKTQLDVANGLNVSVLSVADALGVFNQSILALTTERAKQDLTTSRGVDYTKDQIVGEVKKLLGEGNSVSGIYDIGANTYGVGASQITAATTGKGLTGFDAATGKKSGDFLQADLAWGINQYLGGGATISDIYNIGSTKFGLEPAEIARAAKAAGIPGFAVGTNYVPRDMLAQIHEGEAIVPKAYNPAANGGGKADTARLEALVEKLTAEVQGLRAEAAATAGHTAKTARILDRVTPDGDALQTRATA